MLELFATPRLTRLLLQVKMFMEMEIYPKELKMLKMPFDEVHKQLRSKKEMLQKMGTWNLYLPKAMGGPSLKLTEVAQVSEIIGRSFLGHYALNCQAPDAGNVLLMADHASTDLKERFLKPLLEGEIRSCFSMTEPNSPGSNPTMMTTSAKREGDEYILNGHKWFSTSGHGAAFAIVMAITNPEASNPYKRASLFLVPTDTPGYQHIRKIPVMGSSRDGWMSHSEIKYDNVRLPLSFRLGEEGEGFSLAQERLGPGRIHHCMRWVGISERCFDMMCRRAATRKISPTRMLGEKQMIQSWIAESRAEIDAARLMVLHTAYKIDMKGKRASAEDISTIKFYVSNVLQKVIDRAIQVHGALGVTDDTILSFFYREERGARIYDGADEAHKASLARKILKRYGMRRLE